MKQRTIIICGLVSLVLLTQSCFKEIDTEPIPRTVESTVTIQHSLRTIQSFHRCSENTILEVDTSAPAKWDLAFESAGEGSRVLLGWATYSVAHATGLYDFAEISQDLILDLIENSDEWIFDDPSFVNTPDSLALTGHWETGEIYIQSRGTVNDNYYAIQFVSSDENSYTFRYASALSLDAVHEATVYRSTGFNYVYYSYNAHATVAVEPDRRDWDILCTPYRGWWETNDSGIYVPYNLSGILINNENGVRVARVFDPEVSFSDLDFSFVDFYRDEFTDWKGAIGADWKVLGSETSTNIYNMDPDKKYLLEKFDYETSQVMYFKLQIVDYKLNGEDHYPTIEFKYLGSK
jgi:hypothetical protein